MDNPYLAHLAPQQRAVNGYSNGGVPTGSNGVNGAVKVKNPLDGLVPRRVAVQQAKAIMVSLLSLTPLKSQDGDVNPFKGLAPFSASYKKILAGRQNLPVYQKMEEFLSIFSKNQITVMEGQTGSGKTTQIPQFVCYSDLPMLRGKMVACTQPRRVAAMSVAKRVADEMDGESDSEDAADACSATREASWVLDTIRGYDRTGHDLSEIHDGWDVVERGNERSDA